jgi:hypothetical protein
MTQRGFELQEANRSNNGSEQEFDKRPISCGFGESDEFGFGDRHTLSLEEPVA